LDSNKKDPPVAKNFLDGGYEALRMNEIITDCINRLASKADEIFSKNVLGTF